MTEKQILMEATNWRVDMTPEVVAFIAGQAPPTGGGTRGLLENLLWRATLKGVADHPGICRSRPS